MYSNNYLLYRNSEALQSYDSYNVQIQNRMLINIKVKKNRISLILCWSNLDTWYAIQHSHSYVYYTNNTSKLLNLHHKINLLTWICLLSDVTGKMSTTSWQRAIGVRQPPCIPTLVLQILERLSTYNRFKFVVAETTRSATRGNLYRWPFKMPRRVSKICEISFIDEHPRPGLTFTNTSVAYALTYVLTRARRNNLVRVAARDAYTYVAHWRVSDRVGGWSLLWQLLVSPR